MWHASFSYVLKKVVIFLKKYIILLVWLWMQVDRFLFPRSLISETSFLAWSKTMGMEYFRNGRKLSWLLAYALRGFLFWLISLHIYIRLYVMVLKRSGCAFCWYLKVPLTYLHMFSTFLIKVRRSRCMLYLPMDSPVAVLVYATMTGQ